MTFLDLLQFQANCRECKDRQQKQGDAETGQISGEIGVSAQDMGHRPIAVVPGRRVQGRRHPGSWIPRTGWLFGKSASAVLRVMERYWLGVRRPVEPDTFACTYQPRFG
ncbi:hypothetical protein GT347_25650 [Xylophilus rhododendri]|uniref:Uncharacterized protein n=1 Tax=Xylophilus rhododendri TaxID=2697032 RepID=A0A857JAM7_9BURK|nr:hypothetical protein [Xylophilus rhododendri]QHJ01071.1 hypothetical protein GT347_25650 [Xylophilus rhododendri]